jgi:hypothetical protein
LRSKSHATGNPRKLLSSTAAFTMSAERPHWSLELKSPVQFLLKENPSLCKTWWPNTQIMCRVSFVRYAAARTVLSLSHLKKDPRLPLSRVSTFLPYASFGGLISHGCRNIFFSALIGFRLVQRPKRSLSTQEPPDRTHEEPV